MTLYLEHSDPVQLNSLGSSCTDIILIIFENTRCRGFTLQLGEGQTSRYSSLLLLFHHKDEINVHITSP